MMDLNASPIAVNAINAEIPNSRASRVLSMVGQSALRRRESVDGGFMLILGIVGNSVSAVSKLPVA
jgi:hypothetical protein